jgi:hypothetical protein
VRGAAICICKTTDRSTIDKDKRLRGSAAAAAGTGRGKQRARYWQLVDVESSQCLTFAEVAQAANPARAPAAPLHRCRCRCHACTITICTPVPHCPCPCAVPWPRKKRACNERRALKLRLLLKWYIDIAQRAAWWVVVVGIGS